MQEGGERTRSGGASRGLLRFALLVLLGERKDHGYALLERLGEAGLDGVDRGGMYRALRTLEGEAAVRSWWTRSTGGAPRRVYALTKEGEAQLGGALDELADHRNVVGGLVDRGRAVSGRSLRHPGAA